MNIQSLAKDIASVTELDETAICHYLQAITGPYRCSLVYWGDLDVTEAANNYIYHDYHGEDDETLMSAWARAVFEHSLSDDPDEEAQLRRSLTQYIEKKYGLSAGDQQAIEQMLTLKPIVIVPEKPDFRLRAARFAVRFHEADDFVTGRMLNEAIDDLEPIMRKTIQAMPKVKLG